MIDREAIAVRRFVVAGTTDEVVVSLEMPEPRPPDGTDWLCPFVIVVDGEEQRRYAAGFDAFQSLELALRMIGAILFFLNREFAGRLRWNGSTDLGFPMPE